jgi:hypothetical protein
MIHNVNSEKDVPRRNKGIHTVLKAKAKEIY